MFIHNFNQISPQELRMEELEKGEKDSFLTELLFPVVDHMPLTQIELFTIICLGSN